MVIRCEARLAYMNVGKECEHDCMDAGDRVTQEQLPRSGSFAMNYTKIITLKEY